MTLRTRSAAAALAVLALTLVGCSPSSSVDPEASSTSTPGASESTPTATDEPTPAETEGAEIPSQDTTDWLMWESSDGYASFRYPADWSVADEHTSLDGVGPDDANLDAATVTGPNGQELLHYADLVDIGGACAEVFPVTILDEMPTSLPGGQVDDLGRDTTPVIGAYAIERSDARLQFGLGITEIFRLDGEDTCTIYNVAAPGSEFFAFGTELSVGVDPLWTVDTIEDARAYMQTDEYATLVAILDSLEVR